MTTNINANTDSNSTTHSSDSLKVLSFIQGRDKIGMASWIEAQRNKRLAASPQFDKKAEFKDNPLSAEAKAEIVAKIRETLNEGMTGYGLVRNTASGTFGVVTGASYARVDKILRPTDDPAAMARTSKAHNIFLLGDRFISIQYNAKVALLDGRETTWNPSLLEAVGDAEADGILFPAAAQRMVKLK